ncbi:MAG: 50S ribosomal protein L17 [Patescibacteria group bacterium]|jgi:large subunit ribosomal protein L17
MRHKKSKKNFKKGSYAYRNIELSLAVALIEYEKIKTTVSKAKRLRSYVEKLITTAKKGGLHARRQILAKIRNNKIATKLLNDIAPRYKNRKGGYTSILKIGPRKGDGATEVYIKFI